jgi:hypothetical protein
LLPFLRAFRNRPETVFASACGSKAVLLGMALALGGCGSGGFSLERADVDRSIVTASVPAASSGAGSDITADQATIRNAVSSADIEEQAGKPLAWSNPETGARGAITEMAETRDKGRLCRSFSGSRENFDGVSMFQGEACMAGPDLWRIEAFKVL